MCHAIEYKYSPNCIGTTSLQFHMLHVILHESDLQYGVNAQHCSTTNSVGMHVNTLRGARLRSPNNLCAMES